MQDKSNFVIRFIKALDEVKRASLNPTASHVLHVNCNLHFQPNMSRFELGASINSKTLFPIRYNIYLIIPAAPIFDSLPADSQIGVVVIL